MAKVRSERDLVDHGIRALVDALGYGGAARFLRHFSKGHSDYLEIQEKLFKGMRLDQIYKKAGEQEPIKSTAAISGVRQGRNGESAVGRSQGSDLLGK